MKTHKRVLLLTPSMSKGGAETQLLKVAVFLQSHGHDVQLLSLKPIDEFGGAIAQLQIPVVYLKSWQQHPLANIRAMCSLIKHFKPDVVIAFMFIAIIFARLLKLKYRFSLVSTIRISVIPFKWNCLFKATTGLDDALVYNSHAAKHNFERMNRTLRPCIVIHNGVTLPDLSANEQVTAAAPVFTWVCIAHFRWNKDYVTLFRAVALLRNPDFRLQVIGELKGLSWPHEVVKALGIEKQVSLLGFRSATSLYLKQADAFVLSSFSEGMPNALLEAMAHAKPVVVSDIDGNRELIQQAECGLLCAQGDAYEMAAAMRKVMEMKAEQRRLLGERGREYIERRFAEDKVMQEWMQLVESLSVKL